MKQIEGRINNIKSELDKLIEDVHKADIEDKVFEFVNNEFTDKQKEFEFKAYRAFVEFVMKNNPYSVAKCLDIPRKYIDHIGTEFDFDFDKYLPR